MKNQVKRHIRTQQEWEEILKRRFDYLSHKERDELVYGNKFVKVPSEELKRLRIDAYPYLM
jgi:hypothetical protein